MEISSDCDIDAVDVDSDTVGLEESTSDTVDDDVRAYPITEPNYSTTSEFCSIKSTVEPTSLTLKFVNISYLPVLIVYCRRNRR